MKKKIVAVIAGLSLCASIMSGCGKLVPNYSSYVELGQYEGIEYVPLDTTVTEEEIQEQIDYYLQNLGETTEVYEGKVKDGDTINLDYVGYCDGIAFEGGNTEGNGATLTIGSHSYIDDFEDQLIGHEVGEEGIEVNVTFPDPYQNADLAGKDATFVCTINSIYVTSCPDKLTDDIVAANSEYDTVNSFKDALRMDYENYKNEQAESKMQNDLIVKVIENATINGYPEKELDELKKETIEAAKETAESYQLEYETYVGYLSDENGESFTVETYEQAVEKYMKELLDEKMVVTMIAKELGITVNKKDIDAYVQNEVATNEGANADTIYESYSMDQLAYAVLHDKVMEYLVENAVAIEE